MLDVILAREGKSLEAKAFEYWARTGIILKFDDSGVIIERKFNPYHDPDDGRFTFAPGGGSLPPRAPHSRSAPAVPRQRQQTAGTSARREHSSPDFSSNNRDFSQDRSGNQAQLIPAQYRPNPRAGMRGNGGPPLNDPMTLDRVFPGAATSPATASSPGRAITAMADNILDITGPGARITSGLAADYTNMLIRQIRRVDPAYRHESLGFPQTFDGQINMIRQLRIDRALAFHRKLDRIEPIQVETLRYLQDRTDGAYDRAVARYNAGRLRVRLSREEAIGNFVDREVRKDLRDFFNRHRIATSPEGPFRAIGREYASSGTDRTYRIPDARVGNIAFDVSLTRKLASTPQVRGFFAADFRPDAVIIVRPSQLGQGSTYRISKPGT